MRFSLTLPNIPRLKGLRDRIAGLRGRIARLRSRCEQLLPTRRMLAVEISGHHIIGAVAKRKGRRLAVENFVTIERSNPTDDLPDPANLRELMERLEYPAGPMVLVTPMARSVQITMNRAKVKRLRQHQLCDALRWEVEPYTGISGTQALIGAERISPAEQEELVLLAGDEEEMDVNVSVIEQNVYRAMRQVCKRAKLRLIRLYPPEVCFFMPLFLHQPETAQAVFDIGQDYANFTVIKGRQPKQINTYPLGRDVLMELVEGSEADEVRQSLDFLLRQVPGPLPLLLTGIGATQQAIVDYLHGRCEYGVSVLELHRDDKLGRSAHDSQNAVYAIAAGAALRELSGPAWRLIGITDAVPLPVVIRQSGHLLPIGAAVLMVGALLGHYGYMKTANERYKAQTKKLESQIRERKQKFESHDKMESELKELEKKVADHKRKIAFLQEGADDNLIHLEQVLGSFFTLPLEMRLDSLAQNKEGKYLVMGMAPNSAIIAHFAVHLQQHPWCRAVSIKTLEQKDDYEVAFQMELATTGGDYGEAEEVVEEETTQAKKGKGSRKRRR
ncbi:MAG: hypothetical protein ACOX5Z_05085 [Desulfobulbus sp.]|jgi:Tfp pilus assembly PilM family ATPase